MRYELFIARRVAATGEQSFARLIIRIATVAVALSMAVMICSTALISGFKKEISEKIFGFWGHIHITDTEIYQTMLESAPISRNQSFYPGLDTIGKIEYLRTETNVFGQEVERWKETKGGIRHIQTFALEPGIVKAQEEIEGIILKGIGDDFDWSFLQRYLVRGERLTWNDTAASDEILISEQTADRLKVDVDSNFLIYFFNDQGTQIRRRFQVAGVYKTGLEEYDRKFALIDIRKIRQLLDWAPDQVGGFEVFVENIDDLEPIAEYIYYEELPNDLFAETIRRKLPEIFEWLSLQDINEVVILSLMIIVAIINMVTALMILILERTYMIGTLKALGSSSWSIRKIFLYYAAYIVAVGILWGNGIGIALCLIQQYGKVIKLQEENYYLPYAPIDMNIWVIILLNLGSLLITLLFLVVPSYLVARISPIKSIRFK